ncbi:MAG: hypothetical protein ACR2RB_11755, partial [Gammaproteobacteria bacterium]
MAEAGKQPQQFWRGNDANVAAQTGAAGEPIFGIDVGNFYVCNAAGAPQFIGPVTTLAATAITAVAAGNQTDINVGDALNSMTTRIDNLVGGVNYVATWDAATDTPVIPAAAAANKGDYYRVSVAGATNKDGITDWQIGDWIISN